MVIRRVGRRVLIDEFAFFDWVERTNGARQNLAPNLAEKRSATAKRDASRGSTRRACC